MTDLTDDLFLIHPDDSTTSPAAPTLDFTRTPTVLLTFAGNRFTRSATKDYLEKFGIGVMDWRVLVMLTREPGSSVSHAAQTMGIDKAAVSRALQRMEKAGLVTSETLLKDDRRKDWTLTPTGHDLHARILERALERQRHLLKGFDPSEVEAFTGYLRRFLKNLETLNASDQ
jgi:DNA-binding MarR family transcriptional regulator